MTEKPADDPVREPSSPACSMRQADDTYMGYAGRDELVAFLNGRLEAERAGARVTLETARAVRKLREALPRVRDGGLHADLAEMLRSHESNIARASEIVGRVS